jgi:glutamyl-Q tRNA(Asp) synthetase
MTAGTSGYTGRFAPSPTGPLHAGSLLTAVASFLDARAHDGRWLLRIEDIDPPREMPGASDRILAALTRHGLHWDGEVVWQSRRIAAYEEALASLDSQGLIFDCCCTRAELGPGGNCGERCRPEPGQPVARRLRVREGLPGFDDRFLGPQPAQPGRQDMVLWRKDGLPAYQLAVSVDDGWQGISDVVRGADLLHATGVQRLLLAALGYQPPRYAHVPLLCNDDGRKLSKQTGAPPLDEEKPLENLIAALAMLGQRVEHRPGDTPQQLLARASAQWNPRAAIAAAAAQRSPLRLREAPR